MALADTAQLLVRLQLDDKFSGPMRTASGSLDQFATRQQRLGQLGEHIGQGIRNTAQNIARLGVVAGGALAVNIKAGVESLAELQRVEQLTATALKSTGSAAAGSAEDIRKRAIELENLTTVDDKAIQNAENLLLTFRQIGKDAFDPTLKAAINLNAALGGDENSLQGTLIQVGKAINDPIRGLTSLRRVGVSFSEQQQDRIKKLVDENRLYDAQKIIIGELNKEFAGAGKAFGTGPAADMRRFGDAIEDAQQALATGFLPLITDISKRVQEALGDPKVQANIREFGKGLADAVNDLISIGTKLPWEAIGSAGKLLGQGAKGLLQAFTSLPSWVQTAVLTGWGLNKLTGGALGNILGDSIKLAFPKLDIFGRGGPGNPMFVTVTNPGVGGGGPAAGGGGRLLGVAKFVLGPLAAVAIGAEIAAAINKNVVGPAASFEEQRFQAVVDSNDLSKIVNGLNAIERAQHDPRFAQQLGLIASNIPFIGDALGHVGPKLEEQRQVLLKQLQEMGLTREQAEKLVAQAEATQAKVDAGNRYAATLNGLVRDANQTARHAADIAQGTKLATDRGFAKAEAIQRDIASSSRITSHKNFSPSFNANVYTTVNAQLSTYTAVQTISRVDSIRYGGKQVPISA